MEIKLIRSRSLRNYPVYEVYENRVEDALNTLRGLGYNAWRVDSPVSRKEFGRFCVVAGEARQQLILVTIRFLQ
jgi:hypothetical protein